MSAAHRSLARLPNTIFTNLLIATTTSTTTTSIAATTAHDSSRDNEHNEKVPLSPLELKQAICKKLLKGGGTGGGERVNANGNGNGSSSNTNTTIGNNSNSNSNNHININNNGNPTTSSSKQKLNSSTVVGSIATVGQLMRLTPTALLRLLDPLLTISECQELIVRISNHCTPKPKTARYLLEQQMQPNRSPNTQNTNQPQQDQSRRQQQNHSNYHYIPTEVPNLDKILKGGIRYKTITEVIGCAGVGKTQFCMNLAINAIALNYSCIYIDAEKKISLNRLNEIAKEKYFSTFGDNNDDGNVDGDGEGIVVDDSSDHFDYHNDDRNHGTGNKRRKCSPPGTTSGSTVGARDFDDSNNRYRRLKYKPPSNVMKNIMIHSPNSTAELLSVVSGLQEDILLRNNSHGDGNYDLQQQEEEGSEAVSSPPSTYPVKLILLDSIAAPTRRDYGGGSANGTSAAEDARNRVTAIFQIAQMLKQIGDELNVAIVVINQIDQQQQSIVNDSNRHKHTLHNHKTPNVLTTVKASLGPSWHHCVSTRILFEYSNDNDHFSDQYNEHCITQLDSNTRDSGYYNGNHVALSNSSSSTATLSQQVRKATVVKSNVVGCASMHYEVTRIGISQLNF